MKKTVISIVIAAILWFIMFFPPIAIYFDFWIAMPVCSIILIALSIAFAREDITKNMRFSFRSVWIGIASAALLWGIFWVGDSISKIIFPFADKQIDTIYAIKNGENALLLSAMLLFIIGPAEEIFWRGFIQEKICNSSLFATQTIKNKNIKELLPVIFSAAIYSLVHIWSFNFMLIAAAFVCGLFWGIIYKYDKNLPAIIISHALWDVSVFILFPIA